MKWHCGRKAPPANKSKSKKRQTTSREKFLEVVCGLDAKLDPNAVEARGLHAYADHVERLIRQLLEGQANAVALRDIFGAANEPEGKRVGRLLDMCIYLLETFDTLGPKTTFDELCSKVLIQYQVSAKIDKLKKEDKDVLLKAVAACVGWISTLYITPPVTPRPLPALGRAATGQKIFEKVPIAINSTNSNQPIGRLLLPAGLIPVACGTPPGFSNTNITLTTTKLSFASLHGVGGISVQWTDEIAQHCEFNKNKKTIKIFMFPSRCWSLCKKNELHLAFQRVCQAHNCPQDCATAPSERFQTYQGEVLSSYRLLFGQDRRARKLYRTICSKIPSPRDPLLDVLCSKATMPSWDGQESFPERDVCDGRNFPQLGLKLLELQAYITDQRPRALKDVWNDRRNPHEAFTFWAVVLIGGATIVLGVLQIILSALQLVWTIRS